MLATKLQKGIQDSVMSSGEFDITDNFKLHYSPYYIEIMIIIPNNKYVWGLDIKYPKPMISDLRVLIARVEDARKRNIL